MEKPRFQRLKYFGFKSVNKSATILSIFYGLFVGLFVIAIVLSELTKHYNLVAPLFIVEIVFVFIIYVYVLKKLSKKRDNLK